MKKILISIFLFLIVGLNAYACRCDDANNTVETSYKRTEAIMQGIVVNKTFVSLKSTMDEAQANFLNEKLKDDPQRRAIYESELVIKIELKITERYKGEIKADTVIIYTTRTGASCGYTGFELDKSYLVYGSSNSYAYTPFNAMAKEKKLELDNTLWTNHCTRTKVYDEEEATELKKLANK